MAVPTFVGVGATTSSVGSITPALPAGMVAGNLWFIAVETANEAINLPAGWAEAYPAQGVGVAAAVGATRATLIVKRAAAGDAAPTLVDAGDHQCGQAFAIDDGGVDGDPVVIHADDGDTLGTASTSVTIPGLTTTVADCLIVAMNATSQDGTTPQHDSWANASLASLTERCDFLATAGTGGGFGVVTGEKATAGAVSATTATLLNSSLQGRIVIAIAPYSAGSSNALVGAVASVSTVSGSLVSRAALAGVVASASTVTGVLLVTKPLAGTAASASTVTGTLAIASPLAGTVASTSSLTGTLAVTKPLAGVVASASTVTGTLSVVASLVGAAAGASSLVGGLSVSQALAGTIASGSALAGSLTNTAPGGVALAGTIGATSTLSGALTASAGLAGTASGTSTVVGSLHVTGPLAAQVASESSAAGSLTVAVPLAGTAAGTSTLSGSLGVAHPLSGAIFATSTIAGAVVVARPLSGSITSLSTLTATLTNAGAVTSVGWLESGSGVLASEGSAGSSISESSSGVLALTE